MLPHASVAEYFESRKSRGMSLGECDAFVSKIQLEVLMAPKLELPSTLDYNDDFVSIKLSEFDGQLLFKRYIQNNWFKHVQRYDKWLGSLEEASHATKLTATLKRFLGSPGESSVYYRRWMNSRKSCRIEPANMAISMMCRYGFYYTLRGWWEKDKIDQKLALAECKGNVEDSYKPDLVHDSLEAAVAGGCITICRYLVSAIGATKSQPGTYFRAAARAIYECEKGIVRLFVEEVKVDLNDLWVNSRATRTLAQYAVISDRTGSMLQFLVDQGWVAVNRQGGSLWGNVLIAAANCGRLQQVEILLRAGADARIPAESGEYGSALIAAAAPLIKDRSSYETIIVALLDSGADVNQVPNVGQYGSALEAFIWRTFDGSPSTTGLPRIPILKLLLESGADPAMTCNIGQHGSALAAAAFYGMKDLLVMMIDATGKERAIECLQHSRHPSEIKQDGSNDDEFETWVKNVAETTAYLADEVGVDKKTLRRIGIQGVKYKWHGGDGHYRVDEDMTDVGAIYGRIRARRRRWGR